MVAGYASAGPAAFWLRYTDEVEGASLFLVFFERAASRRQALELISPCRPTSLLIPRIWSPHFEILVDVLA